MKFDNILVSGCSWCEHPYDYVGGERYRKTDAKPYSIKDIENRAFGKLLSDKFNVDYKNLANAGNSNDIIFYKVWKYIQQKQLVSINVNFHLSQAYLIYFKHRLVLFHFIYFIDNTFICFIHNKFVSLLFFVFLFLVLA